MPLRSWVGTEPVEVTQHVSPQTVSHLQTRRWNDVYHAAAANTFFQSSDVNELWDIDSIVVEIACSANVGNRFVYEVFRDRDMTMTRSFMIQVTAGSITTIVLQYGTPISANAWIGGAGLPTCHPLLIRTLEPQCGIGIFLTNFDGGTDSIVGKVIYRARTQLQ